MFGKSLFVSGLTMGCLAVLIGAAPAPAQTTASDVQAELTAMKAQLAAQEQRIAQQSAELTAIRSRDQGNWLNERRAQEVKALVREVLSDADTRASLMDSTLNAGWKNGFFLGSEDGNYLLQIRGLLEARYTYSHQNNSNDVATSMDSDRGGFDMARTRFGFVGHVIDPTWKYFIWTGFANDGSVILLDAFITKKLDDNWSITAGQFKMPFWREWLVSETKQQMIERSLLNSLAGAYAQGLMVNYSDDMWRASFAFHDGANSTNSRWSTEDTEYAFTGRGEVKLLGDWKQYDDFESWQGDQTLLVLGGAAHYQQSEYGTTTPKVNNFRWTTDATFKCQGISLFLAAVGNHLGDSVQRDQYGLIAQAGWFVTEKLELIGRFEWADSDIATEDKLHIMTVGANYFFARHQARLSADVGYAFTGVSSTWANNGTGYRIDSPGSDGQIVVRVQMQLLF